MEDMVDDLFSVFNGTEDSESARSAKKGHLLSRSTPAAAGGSRHRGVFSLSAVEGTAEVTDDGLVNSPCTSIPLPAAGKKTSLPQEEAKAVTSSSSPASPASSSSSSPASFSASSSSAPSSASSHVAAAASASRLVCVVKEQQDDAAGRSENSAAGSAAAAVVSGSAVFPSHVACGELPEKVEKEETVTDAAEEKEEEKETNNEKSSEERFQKKKKRRHVSNLDSASLSEEATATAAATAGGKREQSSGVCEELVRAKRARVVEERAAAKEEGKLESVLLLAEKQGGEERQSGMVVETLAADDNCLHEVVRPANCALRFVYYPFETTELKVSPSTTSPEEEEPAVAAAAADASAAANVASAEAAAAAAASATVQQETVLVSTETAAACENRAATGSKEGEEDDIVKRFGPRPKHLPAAAARVYQFKLDTFQQRSVLALEAAENVLVAAHTSAGKTVVAEYAIAMSLRDKQRVVYTSPIKALSNQKYRDFCELFGSSSVGLLTGDVTLQPHASVLVMTTEILRSMLYRGSALLHAIKWVVFDEIHYMRDRERGVVWEESIVLLPRSVSLVFLSATIPNAREFAAWITYLKQQPCHLFFTDYRPTPLQHYLFPAGGDGVYLVVDEKKHFREENFHKALATLNSSVELHAMQNNQQKRQRRARAARTVSNVKKIVLMCHARNYTPVIIFCFSKRECEANATMLLPPAATAAAGKTSSREKGEADAIDLTTPEEKQLIEEVFNNALETLEEDDRQLPQVKSILPLLKRGIGIHHGGLLPFIKEIIEILFQESLVRVLFSTETFSMGVNMPAKTVVFTAVRKWDGQEYRIINSGEYIQMAGRAGRRGLDDRGIVIIMLDEQVDPEEAKQLFLGQAAPLLSTFHLGFNMLLNLFRIEDADPLFMITRSFAYFQRNRKAMQLEQQKEELEEMVARAADIQTLVDCQPEELKNVDFDVEASISQYYELKHDLASLGKELQQICMQQQHIVRYLQAGRILRIVEEDGTDWGWSPCVSKVRRQLIASTNAYEGPTELLLVECLVCCTPASVAAAAAEAKEAAAGEKTSSSGDRLLPQRHKFRPAEAAAATLSKGKNDSKDAVSNVTAAAHQDFLLKVLPFPISSIRSISKCRMVLPSGVDVRAEDAQRSLHFQLKKVIERFEADGGLPVLDPIQDMKIQEPRLHELVGLLAEKEMELMGNPLYEHPLCQKYYDAHHHRVQMKNRLREVRDALDGQKQLVMKEQLRSMRRVLKKLDFLDAQDIVTMKGRVACEITTADELVAAELLFQNVFENMDVEVICAVLSCLVFEEKHEELEPTEETLITGLEKVREVARHIASVYVESRYMDSTSPQPQRDTAESAASGDTANKAVEDYVNKFQHAMMVLTYRWAKGESFASVIADTCLYEGTVIRCMRRLEELMRQMACASKTVGSVDLERKFLEGIKRIRRGIVFSSSLYL